MGKFAKVVAYSSALAAVFFTAGAFVAASWDISLWAVEGRMVLAISWVAGSAAIAAAAIAGDL